MGEIYRGRVGWFTDDSEGLQSRDESILLFLRRGGMVVGQQRVAEDSHMEFASIELREEWFREALVVVEDGDLDGCHVYNNLECFPQLDVILENRTQVVDSEVVVRSSKSARNE